MTREEVLNSIALKKRFCKDCNLPIVVFDNPYFYERLCILDSLYDCVAKFEDFCLELGNYTHDEAYLAEYNAVKDMIIEALKANVYFQEFNNAQFNKPTVNVGKRNLYVEQNDGGLFFSIDMKKANFSALRHYNKEIFVGCETWEEFVGRFTSSKHMAKSKYIRQVVLGACNPKRQIAMLMIRAPLLSRLEVQVASLSLLRYAMAISVLANSPVSATLPAPCMA